MELTALLVISYATNCMSNGGSSNEWEQSCIITRTVACDQICPDGRQLRFTQVDTLGSYSVKYDGEGRWISQSPTHFCVPLVAKPKHQSEAAPLPILPITIKPGFVIFTNEAGIHILTTGRSVQGIDSHPQPEQIPGSPMVIPPPPPILAPLPARRAVP